MRGRRDLGLARAAKVQARQGRGGCEGRLPGALMLKLYRRKGNPVPARHRITTVAIDQNKALTGRGLKALTGRGLVAGLLTAAVALGVGQLVAGVTGQQGSPVVAVGGLSIDNTPPAVKDFAITTFGSHDKLALVSGILVILACFAAGIGAVAVRRLAGGMAGLAIFAAVGLLAALTRPDSSVADIWPTLAGVAAGGVALYALVRTARRGPPARPAAAHGSAGRGSAAGPALGSGGTPATAGPAGEGARAAGGQPARPRPPRPPGRGSPPQGSGPERRRFLVTSGAAAGTAAVAGLGGRLLFERTSVAQAQASLRVPAPAHPGPVLPAGTHFDVPGLSPFVTPNGSFYRVDTAIVLPEVPPSSWSLRIHGMVAKEIEISFKELIRRPLLEDYITLTCVSNPVGGPYVGNARWLGASVASLLREAGVRAGADQLLCTSVDGFTSGTPLQTVMDGRDAMLAVAMNGTALPVEHGFPVRMVVPGLYGYVSACKWITDIEVTTFAANHAYWTVRGWDQQAPIKTESRIDVPTGQTTLRPGRIAVAGVAWAQHKGIAAVEARVDGGPWQQARLAAVPDIDTWRQWVWEWEATPGNHLLQARATDKTGYTQTAIPEQPPPNGATGYPAVSVVIDSG
jgi:DMSO/TMAO reductase YedYZ molybdopterin-dependent catalytic subunit